MPQFPDAIDAARRDTAAQLLQAITKMDPRDFEFLIKALLDAQGYDDVEVTQFSGDRGIDLIATLSSGGISKIKTVVQAKRSPSAGLPIVQRLRGTLAKVNAGAGFTCNVGHFFARGAQGHIGFSPAADLAHRRSAARPAVDE
jgi:restriction system protein